MAGNLQTTGLQQLKGVLANETMRKNFENILKDNAGAFMASIIELYQSDGYLQKCNPNAVVLEALKAATLKLPINKSLGFAYIIPYGTTPTMQLGYKGIIQLAQRSGQYRHINAGEVYEGEEVNYNRITGMLDIGGAATSDNVIGYYAYFQLQNGFEKAIYWDKDRVIAHAKKFSQAYKAGKKDSPWFTNFDAMAIKTVLKSLITRYGPMSIEFADVMARDTDDRVESEVAENANGKPITIEQEFAEPTAPDAPVVDDEEGPGF